jgi:hypothetical protein
VISRRGGTLDTLLTYLLNMAEAGPDDVRNYMEAHPFDDAATAAPPPASPPAVATARAAAGPGRAPSRVPVPRAEASLVHVPSFELEGTGPSLGSPALELMMQGMSLSSAPAPAAAPSAAAPSRAAAGEGVPARGGQAAPTVPRGTSLSLVSVRGGAFFFMRNYERGVEVRGPASADLFLDRRMDFHRLVREAEEAGVVLRVTVNGVEWQAAPRSS